VSKKKKKYLDILEEFDIEKYNDMLLDKHHGLTRYDHSLRVAKNSFYLSYFFRADVLTTTRAALMHDFFTNDDIDKKQFLNYLKTHPETALENSKKYFTVSEAEEQIIKSHMFPIGSEIPSSKEAWIVSFTDKYVSIYEFFRFQLLPRRLLK
jgi:uncharacterized protein